MIKIQAKPNLNLKSIPNFNPNLSPSLNTNSNPNLNSIFVAEVCFKVKRRKHFLILILPLTLTVAKVCFRAYNTEGVF